MIRIYYDIDYGKPIDKYLELIQINLDYNIYISRRSLKHFVESRKKEMVDSHTKDDILNKLYFAIDNIILTYKNHDDLSVNNNRLIYVKYFSELRESSLRIVLDATGNKLEICSVHFKKYKKPP